MHPPTTRKSGFGRRGEGERECCVLWGDWLCLLFSHLPANVRGHSALLESSAALSASSSVVDKDRCGNI